MNEILTMKNITVDRNGWQRVLAIESFSIRRGELIALVGPNGAGKSTLLQTIDLLQPYQGTLLLFGEKPNNNNSTELRRRCSMVFQDLLLVNGSVFENVSWPLRFRGLPSKTIAARVNQALVDFGCDHLANRAANNLSGGEAQRVCIARALVQEPELLLLDEPFASLDVAMRNALMEEIRAVAQNRGIAVLLVSHNYSDVLDFAERTVAMFDGQIIQDDQPENLLRRPKNERVARLVGMDNILPCRLETVGDQQFANLGGGIRFAPAGPLLSAAGICCLPGDALILLDELGNNRINGNAANIYHAATVAMDGVIERVTPGIGCCRGLVRVEELQLIIRLPREFATGKLKPGDRVRLGFDPLEVHFI